MKKTTMITLVVILSIIGYICGLALGVYDSNQPVNENTRPQTYQIRTEAI